MVGDLGAIATGAGVVLGDRLGLFKALREGGRMTPAQLAQRTGTQERLVREWLSGQAAAGYIEYEEAGDLFYLSPEQGEVFANEDSPAFMAGAFEVLSSLWIDEEKVSQAFRSGKGLGWHEHSACLFRGTERFFRPGYNANLIDSWLPALEGVVEKLERGAAVADVGCGHGASTVLMARAFPESQFFGFDYHGPSVERATEAAKEAGVSGNTEFQVASAKTYPGTYDLVAFFDCLHDMGDPAGAAAHVCKSLKPDGTWMIVEPFAHDHLCRQPQSGGQGLLCRVHLRLHARLAISGGRPGTWRAGRGSTAARRRDRRRLHPVQARRRNAVQHGARSATVRRCYSLCL